MKMYPARALDDARDNEDSQQGGAHAAQPKHERKLRVQEVRKAKRQGGRRGREQHLCSTRCVGQSLIITKIPDDDENTH